MSLMQMSSASQSGRPPGQPQKYVGEYKKNDWILCPRVGESLDIVLRSKIVRGGGQNSQVCKITGRQPQGFDTFLNPYMVLKIGNLAIKTPHLKPWNSFASILEKRTRSGSECSAILSKTRTPLGSFSVFFRSLPH